MSERDESDNTTAGAAALSICMSLLIALNELKVIDDKETRAVLMDAAETHRNAIPISANPDEHHAIVALIERIVLARNWLRKV